ncbi:MarR family transcriptional regulator for hemolysin [Pseudoduganella lurida]|uniref:MarR family transcriptional regulator for hemolysin n=1 Tax=Pseudoduganella lurida TaxID=1036180 RepID=A0A562RMI2_9BURK|nr:MarR family transcriptional regulator [Pseudoduganella lurida]TWI69660.1 MarR family transcriptional regulator for hemolysin [Pseudoduganella lurida]
MTPEERFSHALHNTARAWRLALDRRMKHLGLSQASWLAIATLAKGAPLSQTELAARLGVENPTMVAMIDRLVKGDYLVRIPSGTDRRVKLVGLTERGREIYAQLRAVADPFRHELLGGIDRAQLQAVTDLLETLQGRIEQQP